MVHPPVLTGKTAALYQLNGRAIVFYTLMENFCTMKKDRFTMCFRMVYSNYFEDKRVYDMLKRVGPPFPLPGPLYDYMDLVAHIQHSLMMLCLCDPDRLPEYDLYEIYHRRARLSEEVPKLVRAGLIRDEEYDYYMEHIEKLVSSWEKDFKRFFLNCVCEEEK
ncbi:MAG: hypothetical protein QXD60_04430 [Nanopusillaceae archaeon]